MSLPSPDSARRVRGFPGIGNRRGGAPVAQAVLAGVLLALAGTAPAAMTWAPEQATTNGARWLALQLGSNDFSAIWGSRDFKKYFIGGYGISPDIEPKVTPAEQAILQQVMPWMGRSNAVAARIIEKQAKAGASAILDFTLGNLYLQLDDPDRAAARFKTATARAPNFRRCWRSAGLLWMRLSKFEDAIKSFARVVELGGGDAFVYGLMGVAYTAIEDFLAAESSFRNAMMLQPDNLDWRLGLARVVFKQQKFEEAAALLDVLIEKFPDRADFWLLQANAFLGAKKPLKAAENLETAVRMGRSSPEAVNLLGDIYAGEGLAGLAARAYANALRADPAQKTERPLRNIETLVARGAFAEAKSLLAATRETYGTNLVAAENRQLLKLDARLALNSGAGDAAAAVLEELLRGDPLDGETLLLLAQHRANKGENEQAILLLERAAGLEKFEFDAVFRHARLLVKSGRYDDAIPLLKRALELRPRDDVARFKEQVERAAKSR